MSTNRIAVVGAGSWGTALACVLSSGGETYLWSRDPSQVAAMQTQRRNPRYLTHIDIPKPVFITADLADAVYKVPIVVVAVPAKAMLTTARALSGILRTQKGSDPPLVLSAAKGLDPESGRLMSVVLSETLGDRAVVGALSGPNIALEIAQGMPATTVVACRDGQRAAAAQGRISGPRLRAYTNDDVVGVEVGGALKNVIAIGTGMCDGLEAGDNAKAAIMTRGLVEMTRLGLALGAQARTFAGLTGLGDLVVTCSSPHSRNRALGIGIGSGKTLAELEAGMTMVAEGVNTTRAALRLAKQLDVELPITEAVGAILFDQQDPMQVAIRLMQRTGRSESEGLGLG